MKNKSEFPERSKFVTPALVRTESGNWHDLADPGEMRKGKRRGRRRSVMDEETSLLADLAVNRVVLEIGTGVAVSTRALASTAKRVVTVDPDTWVQDPGISNVVFLRELPEDMSQFNLVFIDGDHYEQSVVADLTACRAIPMVVMHDTNLEEVQRAQHHFPNLVEVKAWETLGRLAVYRWD